MKFLLVVPKVAAGPGHFYTFPLGLAYILSALKQADFDVTGLNLNHSFEASESLIARTIREQNIDVVLTGGLSPQYALVKQIVAAAVAARPGIITIIGGGLVTAQPEVVYGALHPTYGVIGEGELTVTELAAALTKGSDVAAINGLIYTDAQGQVRMTTCRKAVDDLDTLPWADYEDLDFGYYVNAMPPTDVHEGYLNTLENPRCLSIISSRSCPFDCSFCFHPLGRKYRQRSLDNFFSELEALITKYSINALVIFDELFAHDKKRLHDFCARIKPLNLKWTVQIRVDLVTEEVLRMMRDAGCVFISYGIESMSDKVLDSMNKKTTRQQIERALKLTYDSGIGIQGNLIFGDTGETIETVEESLEWWRRHRRYFVCLSIVQGYPGTKLYKDAEKLGKMPDPVKYLEAGCPPINTSSVGDDEYNEIVNRIWPMECTMALDSIGEITSLTIQPERHPIRNVPLLTFSVLCPHCHETVTFRNYPVGPNPRARAILQIACRACNRRMELAFSLMPKADEPQDISARFAMIQQYRSKGQNQEAMTLCAQILAKDPWHEGAAFVMAEIYLRNMMADQAIPLLTRAAMVNPLNADTQALLAAALILNRKFLWARMHLEYADGLRRMMRNPQLARKLTMNFLRSAPAPQKEMSPV